MGPGCITRFYNLYLIPILYLKKDEKKSKTITNLFVNEIGQGGIAHEQPTPGGDSVGLVLELLGPQLGERLEQVGLDQV